MYCEGRCELADRCHKLKLLHRADIALRACKEMYGPHGNHWDSPFAEKITQGWQDAVDANVDHVTQCVWNKLQEINPQKSARSQTDQTASCQNTLSQS